MCPRYMPRIQLTQLGPDSWLHGAAKDKRVQEARSEHQPIGLLGLGRGTMVQSRQQVTLTALQLAQFIRSRGWELLVSNENWDLYSRSGVTKELKKSTQ